MSTIPHITVSSSDYAKIEALWLLLLRRVSLSKALSHREKNCYMDKLQQALHPVDNNVKLARLEAVQRELDGGQS